MRKYQIEALTHILWDKIDEILNQRTEKYKSKIFQKEKSDNQRKQALEYIKSLKKLVANSYCLDMEKYTKNSRELTTIEEQRIENIISKINNKIYKLKQKASKKILASERPKKEYEIQLELITEKIERLTR